MKSCCRAAVVLHSITRRHALEESGEQLEMQSPSSNCKHVADDALQSVKQGRSQFGFEENGWARALPLFNVNAREVSGLRKIVKVGGTKPACTLSPSAPSAGDPVPRPAVSGRGACLRRPGPDCPAWGPTAVHAATATVQHGH
jgi:hypothetical protein